MKYKLISIIALSMLLCGCGDNINESSSIISSNEPSITDSGESQSTNEEEVLPSEYSSSNWDETMNKMIDSVVGENSHSLIAKMNGSGYKTYFENIDSIDCVLVNIYGVNPLDAISDYEDILVNDGYYLSSSYQSAYRMLDAITDLIIQYQIYSGNSLPNNETEPFLELIIYKYENREKDFPVDIVKYIYDVDFPTPIAESYSYYFSQYDNSLTIYANNIATNYFTAYQSLLLSNNYYISNTIQEFYYYSSIDGYTELLIYQTYDEYNRDSLYIKITSNWPRLYFLTYLGVDLPKFSETYDSNLSYTYSSSTPNFLVYYDNASTSIYDAYCESLILDGWTKIEENQGTNISRYFSKTVVIDNESYEVEIGCLFGIISGEVTPTIILVIPTGEGE